MRAIKILLALGLIATLFVFAVPVAAAPIFASTPAPGGTLVFPSVPVGSVSNAPFQIRNTGDEPLTFASNPTFSGPNASDFAELLVATVTIQPQQTFNMTPWIRCRPSAVGLRTATLTLTTNDPLAPTVSYPLECTGLGSIYASTPLPANSTINFASVLVGTSVSIDLTIENQGNARLDVSFTSLTGTGAAVFSVAGLPLSIDPAASQTMTLTCTPTSTETYSATLNLATNDPSQPEVSYFLQCEGIEPPSPTPIPTETPTPTSTPTQTPTQTPTEIPTETPTPTFTPTNAPTETPTPTESPTETPTPSATPRSGPDYHVCPRFDRDKQYNANSTVKIKFAVCDADGENLSTFDLHVTAVSLVNPKTGEERRAEAPGDSNPRNRFCYNPETGTYGYELKTKGLSQGTWNLVVAIGGDPNPHTVSLKVV
jgi:outer membrane biosynthesis protein TonB